MFNKLKKHPWLYGFMQLLIVIIIFLSVRAYKLKDAINGEAPIIMGQLLTGQQINLKQYRGHPVLVHFWATWCPICKIENSSIASIANDLPVLTIASWSEGAKEVVEYMHSENLQMPVLLDESGEWAKLYGVKGVPSSFIVDGNGHVQFVTSGYTTELGLRLRMWWLDN
jgi:thiol-disulfide isomerase/thioredoxin